MGERGHADCYPLGFLRYSHGPGDRTSAKSAHAEESIAVDRSRTNESVVFPNFILSIFHDDVGSRFRAYLQFVSFSFFNILIMLDRSNFAFANVIYDLFISSFYFLILVSKFFNKNLLYIQLLL